nr:mycothiol synthase [Nocardioides aquaticus]
MRDLLAEAAAADGQDPVDESVHLRLKHQGLDGTDLWTDGAADGPWDGVALRHEGALDLVVRPGARGRGVGSGLAAQALAAPGEVTAWSHGHHPAAARIATAQGLERVRDLWVMRRPVGPAAPPLPEVAPAPGVRLGHWRDGWEPDPEAETAALLAVNGAAFAHHPEQGGMDRADLAARMAEDWFDPSGLLLATDEATGDLLGFHWTKQHSSTLGEVYVVGIAPAAQGRGLGRTLTLAGLHHLAGRGVGEVLLYVESDNAPAVAVYSRLGFDHADVDTHVMYRRPA